MDITQHNFKISKVDREKVKNQKACTIWMSGLSGSGKSTIANQLETFLNELGFQKKIELKILDVLLKFVKL